MPVSNTKALLLTLTLITIGCFGSALFWLSSEMDATKATIAKIEAQLNVIQHQHGYRFKSQQDFQEKLQSAIETMVANKRQEAITERFSKYTAAPEQAPQNEHLYGAPDARFTLIEFSDMECPYCKRYYSTPKLIVDASKGEVNLNWKHLPLSFHNPAARNEALASECIAQEYGNRAFWVFIDEIFKASKGNGQGAPLMEIARKVGAEPTKLQECVYQEKTAILLDSHARYAAQNGITGTPALLIVDNLNRQVQKLEGAQPVQAIAAVIRKMTDET